MTLSVLFNGVWQGALLALVAYAVCLLLPKRDAATRCVIWLTTLVAIAMVPPATTLLHAPFTLFGFLPEAKAMQVTIRLAPLSTLGTHDRGAFAAIARWLPALWALGAAVNYGRMIWSFISMEMLSRRARPYDMRSVRPDVFISEEIEVPLVAGIAPPRILIPSSLAATLDAADLERIVAHERAHISRRDPAFNLLARTIEAALFFNPAVHFVKHELAREREAACDDLAIAQGAGTFDYAACLAAVAQMRSRRIEVTVPGALGFRTALVARIQRLQSTQPRITFVNHNAIGGIIVLFATTALALQMLTPALALTPIPAHGSQTTAPFTIAATCAIPNSDAEVVTPQPPELPHGLQLTGKADAIVTIAPTGHLNAVRMLHSSGNSTIDAAVVSAARRSSYRAKIANCVPVEGSYIFHVEFKP